MRPLRYAIVLGLVVLLGAVLVPTLWAAPPAQQPIDPTLVPIPTTALLPTEAPLQPMVPAPTPFTLPTSMPMPTMLPLPSPMPVPTLLPLP